MALLNKRKLIFVDELLRDRRRNQTELAILAGYSKKSAKVQGHRLMKDPAVLAEIQRRTEAKVKTLENANLEDDDVINGLLQVIEDYEKAGPGSWQMANRIKCWELIGKHRKMFSERVELGFGDALVEKLHEGRKRAGMLPAPSLSNATSAEESEPEEESTEEKEVVQ